MSWTRTILYGTGLSGVFYFYFGTLIVGELTVWVLQALAPALRWLSEVLGIASARALGRALAFTLGVAGTFAFVLPMGMVFKPGARLMVAAALVIAPVIVMGWVGLDAGDRLSAFVRRLDPVVGALLAVFVGRRRPGKSLLRGCE